MDELDEDSWEEVIKILELILFVTETEIRIYKGLNLRQKTMNK